VTAALEIMGIKGYRLLWTNMNVARDAFSWNKDATEDD
jgi:hypothetical protein